MPDTPHSLRAAGVSDRIAAAIPDPARAAETQRYLRQYQPVWDIAHDPAVLEALVAASQEEGLWWRPMRVALTAVATWLDLADVREAEQWLLSQGRPILALAAGSTDAEPTADDLARAETLLARPLVRSACAALYHHGQGQSGDWLQLPADVLTCLFELEIRVPQPVGQTSFIVALARGRPATAADLIAANGAFQESPPSSIVPFLSPAQALTFVRGLSVPVGKELTAALLPALFQLLPEPGLEVSIEGLADATVGHLRRGLGAWTADPTVARQELERSWQSGRSLAAQAAYRLGDLCRALNDPMASLPVLQLGLALAPDEWDLRASLAGALNDLGQFEEAMTFLDGAPADQRAAGYPLVWQRARALAGLQSPAEAVELAQKASNLAQEPDQWHQVAGLMARLGAVDGAIDCLERAVGLQPGQRGWYVELGDLYLARSGGSHDLEAAEACYRQVVALTTGVERAPALLKLAAARRACGDPMAALQSAAEAAHLQPNHPETLHAWAYTAYLAGQWETSVRAGQAALSLQPDSTYGHILVGFALAALNQEQEALYYLRRATQLPIPPPQPSLSLDTVARPWAAGKTAPDQGPDAAWLALAGFLEQQGQAEEAERILNEGLQVLGENQAARLLFRLAALYEETGRLTEAQTAYSRLYQTGDRSPALSASYGRVLGRLGHRERAIAILEEAIAHQDPDGTLYHALALILEADGQPLQAAAAARQAAQRAIREVQVALDAGRLSLAAEQPGEATPLLRKAISMLPTAPPADSPALLQKARAWAWLGESLESLGQWEAALDAHWSAARLDPANPHFQRRLGVVSTRLGRLETAIAMLREAAERLPTDPVVRDELAVALEASEWWDEAKLVRQQAADMVPDDVSRLLAAARAARRANDLTAAAEWMARARQASPDDESLLLEWAFLQRTSGDSSGAVETLEDLIQVSGRPQVLAQAGQALMDLGQAEAAAIAYSRAADLVPQDPEMQARLGQASAALGDPSRALVAYQAASRLEPDNPSHQVAIGEMHWQMDNSTQAAKAWEASLQLDPDAPYVLGRLACAYARQSDPAKALALFERAAAQPLAADSSAGGMWTEAGRVALELGELGKARAYLDHALKTAPDDPEVHSLVGALADRVGKPEEAIASYRRAVELAPGQLRRAYLAQLADALTDSDRDADALEVWQELAREGELGEGAALMLGQMGRLYARANRYQEAERSLRAALKHAPGDELLQTELASVVVERAEQDDYRRRARVPIALDRAELEEAVSRLTAAGTPQAKRDLARAHLLLSNSNQAIAGLTAYLSASRQAAGGDLKAQRALGIAYRQAGALDLSLEALSLTVRLAPNDPRAAVELAQTYLQNDELQAALTLLERLAKQHPDDPVVHYHCATAGRAAGEVELAIQMLRRATELDPSVGPWQRVLAGWLRAAGESQAGMSPAETALRLAESLADPTELAEAQVELARVKAESGDAPGAIALWQAALDLAPTRVDWWIALGQSWLAADQPSAAVAAFAEADRLAATATLSPALAQPEALADLYLGWAEGLLLLAQLEAAGRQVARAVEIAPDYPRGQAALGRWQAAQGRWQDALTSFQRAVLLSGDGQEAWSQERARYLMEVARAYHALDASDQALQELGRAAQQAPASADVFALMGDIYRELDQRDQARQAYQQAAKLAPAHGSYVIRLARFLQDEGQLDQALHWLSGAAALRPSADLWIEIARVYQQRGKRGLQLEALYRAADLEPTNSQPFFELGLAHKQRKEYEQAIEAFEKVVQLEPDNQQAHKQLSAVVAISITNQMGVHG